MISDKEITIVVDYPLACSFEFKAKNSNGFTINDLYKAIHKIYKGIYKNPVKYGVFGHDMGELFLEELKEKNGKYYVWMGS